MNHKDDDLRDVPSPIDPESERFVLVPPEPIAAPTPDPLFAAEPPPPAPVEPERFSGPVRVEPSWRNLVGSARAQAPAPDALVPNTADQKDQFVAERSAGAGIEPSLALPAGDPNLLRDQQTVTGAAAEAAPNAALRREPSVTIGRIGEELFAWLKSLASAAVYATLIVTFGFQVARVEGQSMAPTLADQDRLIVNKLAYRIGQPQVGDIVMLYYPLNPDKSFVKRVIAEEGDQIRIVDGRVYRNDVPINDDYVPPEFRSHDDWGPEVVPQGYYFVMGDHRNNSSDSRHWRFVPKKYIIGKVQLRWWPLPHARIF